MLFGKVLDINLLEILGWFIDVNLAIVYVLTNFFIKRIVKIIAIFACGTLAASICVGIVIPSTWFVYLYNTLLA